MKASKKVRARRPTSGVKTAAKTQRKYQKGVRELILKLLASGPASKSELVKRGKFSRASLQIHLNTLEADGFLHREGNRPIIFSLAPGKVAGNEPAPRKAAHAGDDDFHGGAVVLPTVRPDLHETLDVLDRRLAANTRMQDKLIALERLATIMPAPIADLLREIRDDYLQHAV